MSLLQEIPSETFCEACIPVLETKRLAMRAPTLVDAKTVAALANDRRIAENSARIPFPFQVSDAESFIAGANKTPGEFAFLITLHDETAIGVIALTRAEPSQDLELCLWLGVSYWGKGYATEALQAVIDYAFTELGHDALQAGTRVTNPASRRALEKCGFQWTGVGLYRIRAIKSSAPIDRFRLERGIWAAIKGWGTNSAKRAV
jgi:RimJ/RimL family protein N-acetyltransferase